jgi:hypothetical protein
MHRRDDLEESLHGQPVRLRGKVDGIPQDQFLYFPIDEFVRHVVSAHYFLKEFLSSIRINGFIHSGERFHHF